MESPPELKDPNLYQVLAAVKLRRLWRQLLLMKLTDTSAQVRDEEKHKAEQNALEARLSRGLVEFVHNTTIFSIKRLLPADLKVRPFILMMVVNKYSPLGALCGSREKYGKPRGKSTRGGLSPFATPYKRRDEVVGKCQLQLRQV